MGFTLLLQPIGGIPIRMRFQRILTPGFAMLIALGGARAQTTLTWTGTGADASFTTATNWSTNTLPTDAVFSGMVSPAPIVSTAITINSLTYAADVTGFTIGTSGGAVLTIQSFLTHNSASTETIAAPLTLGSAFTFAGPGTQAFLNLDGALTASNGFTASNGIYLQIRGGWNAGSTVTLQGTGTVLEFVNATRTLANNFVNNANLTFGTGATTTVSGVISGTGAVTYNSAVTLNASNTYSGETTIGAATVTIGAVNALPPTANVTFFSPSSRLQVNQNQTLAGITDFGTNGSIGIASARTLTIDNSAPTSIAGAIDGAGALSKTGASTLTLSGTNTFTGATTITGGTLAIGADANLGAAPALAAPAALTINGGALQTTASFTLSPNRGISLGASGGAVLTDFGTTLTYGGIIGGSGALLKNGAGTLSISGANTYAGGTNIQQGTLQLDANGALPAGSPLTLAPAMGASNATLNLNSQSPTIGTLTFGGASWGATSNITIGTGMLTLGGNIVYDGTNGAGSAVISGGTLALGGSRTFNIGDSGSTNSELTISSAMTAAGGTLTKTGGGTLVLSGSSNHASTVINDGTLMLGASNALPSTAGLIINQPAANKSASFDLGGNIQTVAGLTLGGGTTSSGAFVHVGSGGTLTLAGNVVYDGSNNPLGSTISGMGTLDLGGAVRTFDIADSTNATSELFVSTGVTGASGSGLLKTGTGTLILAGSNTFGGLITINQGRLHVGSTSTTGSLAGNDVLIKAVTPSTSAVLDVRSSSVSVGNVTFGGSDVASSSSSRIDSASGGQIILGGALTYIPTNNPSASITGSGSLVLNGVRTFDIGDSSAMNDFQVFVPITGAGGLTKTGLGTLSLTNSFNTFSGRVAIQAGVLTLSSIGGSSTNAISIGSGTTAATLRFGGLSAGFIDRPIDLAGTTGGATLDVQSSGGVTFMGPITASGIGTKTLTLSGNSAFGMANTISGAIANNSDTNKTALLKTGFGTWILSGVNTFTGGVTVNGGTLQLGGTNTLGTNHVTISPGANSNATLDLAGTSQTIGALTLGGSGSAGVVLGTGTLTLGGNVTLDASGNPFPASIAGASPFSGGDPFIGTLALGGATRTFDVGQSTNASAHALTILSNITSSAGEGIIKTGLGSLVMGGNGTYSGGTTVQTGSGSLLVASSSIGSSTSVTSGPLGTGTLTLQTGTTLGATGVFTSFSSFDSNVTLHNRVALGSVVTLGSDDSHQELELAGVVEATNLNTTVHLGGSEMVAFTGSLTAATAGTAIAIDSGGRAERALAAFGGTTGSIGANVTSITADKAALLFATPGSLETTANIKVANNGYVGVAFGHSEVVPTAAALLARITPTDKASFSGTFGFDTVGESLFPHTFIEALDFAGFGPGFTIGSLSGAILSGAITPPSASAGYTFGNGGGTLIVASNLGDAGGPTNASVSSVATIPHNALTVVFQGNNTYTGTSGLTVTNSAAVLDSAGALPTGAKFNLGANGYVGSTEAFSAPGTFASFVSRLGTYESTSILGLDSHGFISANTTGSGSSYFHTRLITEPLNLRGLNSIYLGTATNAVIGGPVSAPAGGALSLAAIGDGYLQVASPLRSGAVGSVVIGQAQTVHEPGTVELRGRNTYAGGTMLLNGALLLGDSSRKDAAGAIVGPLGAGALTLASGATHAVLATENDGDTVLHNNVALGAALQIGYQDSFDGGTVLASATSGPSWEPRLILNGIVSGLGSLVVFSDLVLNGANTFSGGVTLHAGELTIGDNTALGTGPLTFEPFGSSYSYVSLNVAGLRTIANNIVLNGFSNNTFQFGGRGGLTVNGSLTLNGNVSLELGNYPLTINGNVGPGSSGFGRLEVYGYSTVVLNGTNNTYSGGTHVDYGAVVFGSVDSIPAEPVSGLSADHYGYIGVASAPAAGTLGTSFLSRFNKGATFGTIGFDTPSGAATNVFSDAISLSGFSSDARLGSASRAILNGQITPQNSEYRFGGGGGLLEVNSGLTDGPFEASRNVHVTSANDTPLTLRIGGANSYTGSTSIGYSGVIFKQGALPTTGSIYLYGPSYVGTEETDAAKVADFHSRISSGISGTPIIGFDAFGSSYSLSGSVNWPALNSGQVFLGTATSATISATLTLPETQSVYRFAGYKGGQLTVASTLADGAAKVLSVQIGDAANAATFVSPTTPNGPMSSVTLTGANSYTGGTLFAAGRLLLGNASALGSGPLRVAGEYYNDSLDLSNATIGTTAALSIPNQVVLDSTLVLGGEFNFTLGGSIVDGGAFSSYYAPQLYKINNHNVTLSGNNTFSGGIYIAQGTVTFASATAAGTGPLHLSAPLDPMMTAPTAAFVVNSTVNGISGDHPLDTISLIGGATLTINQPDNAHYEGVFSGTGNLVFKGPSASEPTVIRLAGSSSLGGSTTINSGVVVAAGHANAFGLATNAVTLGGGALAVESDVTLANPLTLTSGTLGGHGTFQSATPLQIKENVSVAPGLRGTGTVAFTGGLSLLAGGLYHWQLLDAAGAAGFGWDLISVSGTVDIGATAATPFNFRLATVGLDGSGHATNFDPNQEYSWPVLTATSITGFTGTSQFNLSDTSAFLNSLSSSFGTGQFYVSLNSSSTSLMLNFTPVPEPSTYAMIAMGLAAVFFTTRRRRK